MRPAGSSGLCWLRCEVQLGLGRVRVKICERAPSRDRDWVSIYECRPGLDWRWEHRSDRHRVGIYECHPDQIQVGIYERRPNRGRVGTYDTGSRPMTVARARTGSRPTTVDQWCFNSSRAGACPACAHQRPHQPLPTGARPEMPVGCRGPARGCIPKLPPRTCRPGRADALRCRHRCRRQTPPRRGHAHSPRPTRTCHPIGQLRREAPPPCSKLRPRLSGRRTRACAYCTISLSLQLAVPPTL